MGARVYPSDIYEEVGTSMRKVLCCAGAIAGAVLAVGASAAMADEYVVLYKQDASTAAAHQAIRDWCASHGYEPAGPNWEIYGHWLDAWNTDPSSIRTDVFYLLATDAVG